MRKLYCTNECTIRNKDIRLVKRVLGGIANFNIECKCKKCLKNQKLLFVNAVNTFKTCLQTALIITVATAPHKMTSHKQVRLYT